MTTETHRTCRIVEGGGAHFGDDLLRCSVCGQEKYPESFSCPRGNKNWRSFVVSMSRGNKNWRSFVVSMSRGEYLEWVKTRPIDPAFWDAETCRRADALIKMAALGNFERRVASSVSHAGMRQFLCSMVEIHFGSVEVNALLNSLDAYPEWMHRDA